jgi:hypothetical protein
MIAGTHFKTRRLQLINRIVNMGFEARTATRGTNRKLKAK